MARALKWLGVMNPARLICWHVVALVACLLGGCSKKLVVGSGVVSPSPTNGRSLRFDYTSALNFNDEFISPFDRYFQTKLVPQIHNNQRSFDKASQIIDVGWDGSAIVMSDGKIQGSFQSPLIDAGDGVTWKSVLVRAVSPTGVELPDNSVIETGYDENLADMTGNILLLHFNEGDVNTLGDASKEKNVVQKSGTVSSTDAKYFAARKFSKDDDDRVTVPDFKGANPNTMSVEFWVKTDISDTTATLLSVAVINPNAPTQGDKDYLYIRNPANLQFGRNDTDQATGAALGIGGWHHLAVTLSANETDGTIVVYRDGAKIGERTSTLWDVLSVDNPKYCVLIGEQPQGGTENGRRCLATESGQRFDGLIDEVAIFNRGLSLDEIRSHYQRGLSRYKLSARSCADTNCSSSFVPVNTAGPLYILPGISDDRIFQYKLAFYRDGDSNGVPLPLSLPVRIRSVEIGPSHYYSGAHLSPMSAVKYQNLDGFKEILGPGNEGAVRYQLSPNGTAWYYFNGVSWAFAPTLVQSNTAAELTSNIAAYAKLIGPSTLHFRAILTSPGGSKQSQLESVEFSGEF